jgi:hypothetical protein
MAAHQADYKDLSFLSEGSSRDKVLTELGPPITTEIDAQGNKVDIFKFRQGFSTGNKTVRMLGHGAADVFTLGLWEVVGTPSEAVFNGKDVVIKVSYDDKGKVKDIVYLKGANK